MTEEAVSRAQPGTVVLDSLPYIDPVNEEYERYALSLIEEEMKAIKPPKQSRLPALPPQQNHSALLQQEMKLLKENDNKSLDTDFVSKTRAQAPDSQDVESWKSAVDKARVEYQSELIRSQMLEAHNTNNAAATQWQLHNSALEAMVQDMTDQLEHQRSMVDGTNNQRQSSQQNQVGKELEVLNTKYLQLLHTKHQLSLATRKLESEVDKMKSTSRDQSDTTGG